MNTIFDCVHCSHAPEQKQKMRGEKAIVTLNNNKIHMTVFNRAQSLKIVACTQVIFSSEKGVTPSADDDGESEMDAIHLLPIIDGSILNRSHAIYFNRSLIDRALTIVLLVQMRLWLLAKWASLSSRLHKSRSVIYHLYIQSKSQKLSICTKDPWKCGFISIVAFNCCYAIPLIINHRAEFICAKFPLIYVFNQFHFPLTQSWGQVAFALLRVFFIA